MNGERRARPARAGSARRSRDHGLDPLGGRGVHLVDDADVGHAQVRLAGVVARSCPARCGSTTTMCRSGWRTACRCCRRPRGSRRPPAPPARGSRRSRCRRRRRCPRRGAARTPRAPRWCSRPRRDPRSVAKRCTAWPRGRRTAWGGGAPRRACRRRAGRPRRAASSGTCRSRCARRRPRRPAWSSQHGRARAQEPEVGAGGERARAEVHDVLVRDVGVGEHDLVDPLAGDQVLELVLGDDRDAVRVARAGQLGRVEPAVDVRDLGGGEGDDVDVVAPRKATLKLWKSRPAAPAITTRLMSAETPLIVRRWTPSRGRRRSRRGAARRPWALAERPELAQQVAGLAAGEPARCRTRSRRNSRSCASNAHERR